MLHQSTCVYKNAFNFLYIHFFIEKSGWFMVYFILKTAIYLIPKKKGYFSIRLKERQINYVPFILHSNCPGFIDGLENVIQTFNQI